MTLAGVLALLQPASPDEPGGNQLLGYCIVVAGVVDLLAALYVATVAKIDAERRMRVAGILAMAGLGMIAIGVLVAAGVLGG